MKMLRLICLTLLTGVSTMFNAQAQAISVYRKCITAELKSSRLFRRPLVADFNGDGKKDYAIVLQNKKYQDEISLLILYTLADSLVKNNIGALPDTMSFSIRICPKGSRNCIQGSKALRFNSIVVSSNEYEQLFAYDPLKAQFKQISEIHIGP